MPLENYSRYRVIQELSRHGDRRVTLALDRLTGRRVILKTDEFSIAYQEMQTLLALPPGVGPQVNDAIWTEERSLILIMDELAGQTLQELAGNISLAEVPILVSSLCQQLAHLHRLGFVHTDLKPTNIFILGNESDYAARLLDFGFAQSWLGDPAEPARVRGGTPGLVAPEVVNGWYVDGRADQYSLGKMLGHLFPELVEDPRWRDILGKLTQRFAAHRYPHIWAMHEELQKAFSYIPLGDWIPRYPAGPMRGRDHLRDEIVEQALGAEDALLLVQARSGTGLTRFLLETLLACAESDAPPLALLDLGGAETCEANGTLPDLLGDFRTHRGSLLCGIADTSLGLRFLSGPTRAYLDTLANKRDWRRFFLPAIQSKTQIDIVADCLGGGGKGTEQLGTHLQACCEGEFRRAAEQFTRVIRRIAMELPSDFAIEGDILDDAPPVQVTSQFDRIPTEMTLPLKILARLGPSFTRRTARGLLERFALVESLDQLLLYGYLRGEDPTCLTFATNTLWREAAAFDFNQAKEVEAWIHANCDPDWTDPEQVLRACRRATVFGDAASEAAHLRKGLDLAIAQRREADVLTLFAYPKEPPTHWSRSQVLDHIAPLQKILGPEWTRTRILVAVGRGLKLVDEPLGIELLQRVIQYDAPRPKAEALTLLIERALDRNQRESMEAYLAQFRELTTIPGGAHPGEVIFFEARKAWADRSTDEALALSQRAAAELKGSGLLFEALNLQFQAILHYAMEPEEGIQAMRSALAVASDDEFRAQLARNLAQMYAEQSDPLAALNCAEQNLEALWGRISEARLCALRIQKAWALAELDRIGEASREGRSLLLASPVRQLPAYKAMVQGLLGFCRLHQFSTYGAVTEHAIAWQVAREKADGAVFAYRLFYLCDALLDVEAWDTIRTYAHELRENAQMESSDPWIRSAAARAAALCHHAAGDLEQALEILSAHEQTVRPLKRRRWLARYLHHLGLAHLAVLQMSGRREHADTARRLCGEALDHLEGPAYGYDRGRVLLGLANAHIAGGNFEEADMILRRAAALARSIGSRGMLAQALQDRARLGCEDPVH